MSKRLAIFTAFSFFIVHKISLRDILKDILIFLRKFHPNILIKKPSKSLIIQILKMSSQEKFKLTI